MLQIRVMGRSISRAGVTLMIGLVLTSVGDAQVDAPKTEFEVVSIKPFNPDLSQGGMARMTQNSSLVRGICGWVIDITGTTGS